jgi:hypothetical protein
MHAGRSQASRQVPDGWKAAPYLLLLIFCFSVLNLPAHFVHHLGEVKPDCQLLGLSVSLSATSLDSGWFPTVDRTGDPLRIPVQVASVPLLWETPQARGPPPAGQS